MSANEVTLRIKICLRDIDEMLLQLAILLRFLPIALRVSRQLEYGVVGGRSLTCAVALVPYGHAPTFEACSRLRKHLQNRYSRRMSCARLATRTLYRFACHLCSEVSFLQDSCSPRQSRHCSGTSGQLLHDRLGVCDRTSLL